MFRLATWKVASILALVFCAALLIVPSFLPESAVTAIESRLPSFVPFRPIVLGLDLQGGAHILMEVDSASVIKTQVDSLRDDVRAKMREGKISISGGISEQPRGVVVRIADPAERARALGLLRSLDSRVGGALTGATGHTLDISDNGDGAIQLQLTEAATTDKVRHAVSQSIEVLNRRLNGAGTKETNVQQQGARPHPDRGAGPAGHHQGQGSARRDRQARIPPRRRSGRPAERERGPAASAGRHDRGAEAGDGGGRGPHRRPAEFRLAHRRARRQFPLQPARRTEVRPGDVGERRQAVRHRARRQGDLGAAHPWSDHRRQRPDHRQFHRRQGGRAGGAAARRRAAGQADGRRRAHRRPRPRPGFDRRRQAGRPGRRRAGHRLHADDLRRLRRLRRPRARRAYPAHLRLDGAARRDADLARHRRHRLHHRHGGRFQRAHLRAHPRGGAPRPLGRLCARRRLPTRFRHHRRLQRDDVRRGGDPLSVRVGRGARLRGVARSAWAFSLRSSPR